RFVGTSPIVVPAGRRTTRRRTCGCDVPAAKIPYPEKPCRLLAGHDFGSLPLPGVCGRTAPLRYADGHVRSPQRGRPAVSAEDRPAEYVQSLERGLKIIRTFTPRHPRMTLTEIAERTRMPRSAARRFLLTLQSLGYVRLEGRYFSLSPSVLELGYSYLSSVHPWDAANPLLEQLSEVVGENVLAGVLDGTDI